MDFDSNSPRTPSPPTMGSPALNPKAAGSPVPASADTVHIFSGDNDQDSSYGRPSLLQELYEPESNSVTTSSPQLAPLASPDALSSSANDDNAPWSSSSSNGAGPAPNGRPAEYTMIRRATLPYSRQEAPRPEMAGLYAPPPPFLQHQHGYEPHAHAHHAHHAHHLSAEPAALHGHQYYGHPQEHTYDPQGAFYRQQQQQMHHHMQPPPPHHLSAHPHHAPMPMPPMMGMHPGYPPHGIQVQHTDDAASKETQYLRRRCFNCHTTEPPSWRRSTLNPGKIVCNKCGLYERTHLRPRPLRFDELRAGNKARKNGAANGKGSPKAPTLSPGLSKKAPGITRRSSVSSNGSSTQSGSGTSDWDDSVSVYSSNSASTPPSTSFNSPHPPSLTLSNHSSSPGRSSRSPPLLASPPHSAGLPHPHHAGHNGHGIRLPHTPEIPGLGLGAGAGMARTKPRSNTTGGVGMGYGSHASYPSPPASMHSPPSMHPNSPPTHAHVLHHSSSNSSLHSHHSGHSGHEDELGVGLGEGLYRRTSMPDMHAGLGPGPVGNGWGDDGGFGAYGMGGMGMGMVSVKEEPRSLVV
ncbi:GATA-type domain-containing protein [Mycena chlorophos]|uniref:GATA-type domain-containing protein n=1 Tax=Mycena chlorophos TaxID=658473 RepID=A0A8H6S768_MYCCL|nr:GATA-type domain-containing protein [Mycena chlorophos]